MEVAFQPDVDQERGVPAKIGYPIEVAEVDIENQKSSMYAYKPLCIIKECIYSFLM